SRTSRSASPAFRIVQAYRPCCWAFMLPKSWMSPCPISTLGDATGGAAWAGFAATVDTASRSRNDGRSCFANILANDPDGGMPATQRAWPARARDSRGGSLDVVAGIVDGAIRWV